MPGAFTRRFSSAVTLLNSPQFLVRSPGADLARRKSGVQIPSPPPPNLAGQSVASVDQAALTACWAALGPRTPLRVFDVGLGAAAELVDHQSNPSLDWVHDQPSWRLIVLARGPAPVAR